jgi:hypothetical protein
MSNLAIAVLCLAAAAGCVITAIVVIRRERPKHQVIRQPPPLAATEFIPRNELPNEPTTENLLLVEVQAEPPAMGTEFIPRDLILARQRAVAPSPEPKAVPKPPRAAAPPTPAIIGLTIDELEPLLLAAERALARWARARDSVSIEQLAENVEPELRRALAMVAAAGDDARTELLEPMLRRVDITAHRRQIGALVLLLRNEVQALRCIDQCLADAQLVPAMREVLLLWRGSETNWRLRERARQAHGNRAFWLDLLEQRRIDPGPELLDELLTSADSEWIVRGLQLAKYHDDPERRMKVAQEHMHDMRNPDRRMAAVELALLDREQMPTAWLFCRQMANAPEYPRATELLASLGTAREFDPLVRRLERSHGDGLWLLCRSGRKTAAALAARRLQDTRGDELAAAALRYVIGDAPGEARSAEALLDHWAECAPTLEAGRRYLYGERIGFTNSVRRCLTSRDDRHHRAFGDELYFRSNGKIRWHGRGFAQDTLSAVAGLRTHTIDFELGLGPG